MEIVPRSEQMPQLAPVPTGRMSAEQWRAWIAERLRSGLFGPLQRLGWGGYDLALSPPGIYQAFPGLQVTILDPRKCVGCTSGRRESMQEIMPSAVATLLVEYRVAGRNARETVMLKGGEDPIPFMATFLKQFAASAKLTLPAGMATLCDKTSEQLPPAAP